MAHLTKQKIFDKVSNHLLKQMRKSIGGKGDGECRYISRGRKCAIGCLIPKERYKPELEGQSITGGTGVEYAVMDSLKGIVRNTEGTIGLLYDLQFVHDYNPPREWRQLLKNVAANHRLKVNFDG